MSEVEINYKNGVALDSYFYTKKGIFTGNQILENIKKDENFVCPVVNIYGKADGVTNLLLQDEHWYRIITTVHGYSIKVTDNQPILVYENEKFKWKLAVELTKEDRLVLRKNPRGYGYYEKKNITFLTGEAYILGQIMTDFLRKGEIDTSNFDTKHLNIWELYGCKAKNIKELEIPISVLQSGRTWQQYFITGLLYDSPFKDVLNLSYYSESTKIGDQLQQLLYNQSIITVNQHLKTESRVEIYDIPSKEKFQKLKGLKLNEKKGLYKKGCYKNSEEEEKNTVTLGDYYIEKIGSITSISNENYHSKIPIMNIDTAETHTFVVNGFILHS